MNWREHKDAAELWLDMALGGSDRRADWSPEFCAVVAQVHATLAVAEMFKTTLLTRSSDTSYRTVIRDRG